MCASGHPFSTLRPCPLSPFAGAWKALTQRPLALLCPGVCCHHTACFWSEPGLQSVPGQDFTCPTLAVLSLQHSLSDLCPALLLWVVTPLAAGVWGVPTFSCVSSLHLFPLSPLLWSCRHCLRWTPSELTYLPMGDEFMYLRSSCLWSCSPQSTLHVAAAVLQNTLIMLNSALEYFSGRSMDAFHVPWSMFGHFIPWPILFLLVFSLPPPRWVQPTHLLVSWTCLSLGYLHPHLPFSQIWASTLLRFLLSEKNLNFLPMAKSFLLSVCNALTIYVPQHLLSGCRKIAYVHPPVQLCPKI